MIDRNVESEISPLELKVMEGNLSSDCSQDTYFDPEIHNLKSLLVASKARVAPLDWITIPKSKPSSLQLLTGLLPDTIRIFPESPSNNHILVGSTCVVSSMDKVASSLAHLYTLAYQIFILL